MADKDLAIPIVFPDYLITVETPAKIDIPDLLPGVNILPDRIAIPSTTRKLPFLGHAGILFIEGRSGVTKYYEYGRYPPAGAKGLVRKVSIPDVKVGAAGRPTRASLVKVLAAISNKSGQDGRISGAYIELEPGAFVKILNYASERMKSNADPKRASYELMSNSCLHFMKGAAEAGGSDAGRDRAPQPAGYIKQVRFLQKELDFEPPSKLTVEDVPFE